MIESIKTDYQHTCLIEAKFSATGLYRVRRFFRLIFNSYGLQAIASYRFLHWTLNYRGRASFLVNALLKPVAVFLHKLVGFMYDIHISPDADIGLGLYIGHFGGIHIGRCVIGHWCNINQQVVIKGGGDSSQKNMQVNIGDRVWVGAHSKIESGVTIGTGVTISAGTLVSKNLPDGVLVAGSSCRILQKNYDNSCLLGLPEKYTDVIFK